MAVALIEPNSRRSALLGEGLATLKRHLRKLDWALIVFDS
jgi:hypothetical protein